MRCQTFDEAKALQIYIQRMEQEEMPVIVSRELRREIEISEEFQRKLREKMGGFVVTQRDANDLDQAIKADLKEVGAKMESLSIVEADGSTGSDSDYAANVIK